MKHTYEVRKFEDDESVRIIKRFTAEPKEAKRETKEYAEKHPGIYTLYRIETVEIYFTAEERE